jgi:cytochrome c oxidase assembly protein subunit 15
MTQHSIDSHSSIASWHRNLLITAAIFTVLLIAMGGILCMTQSIRDCPDWPGCFGRFIPPAEAGPIMEYTHRVLAALSGLLILSAAIVGLTRTRRLLWISIPPVVATLLLVEVSYFGAQVVLRGLSPGWAAVDVGSALLVAALMVASAVIASAHKHPAAKAYRLLFRTPFAKLVLSITIVVYIILVSGILVAGKNSVTGCLGWPIYSQQLFQMDAHNAWENLRLILSMIGIVLILAMLVQAWREKSVHSPVVHLARWAGITFLLEMLVQVLILVFGHLVSLLVVYTITMAVFWSLLAASLVKVGMENSQN